MRIRPLPCHCSQILFYINANASSKSHDKFTVAEWSNALDLNALHASSESSLFGGVRSNRAGEVILFRHLVSKYDVWKAV